MEQEEDRPADVGRHLVAVPRAAPERDDGARAQHADTAGDEDQADADVLPAHDVETFGDDHAALGGLHLEHRAAVFEADEHHALFRCARAEHDMGNALIILPDVPHLDYAGRIDLDFVRCELLAGEVLECKLVGSADRDDVRARDEDARDDEGDEHEEAQAYAALPRVHPVGRIGQR